MRSAELNCKHSGGAASLVLQKCSVLEAGSFISAYGELWLTVCIVSVCITGADSKHNMEVW